MSKNLNTRIQYACDTTDNWSTVSSISLAGELYVHMQEGKPTRLSIGDGITPIKDLKFWGEANNNTKVEIPYIPESTTLTYNGSKQSITSILVGYDDTKMTHSGDWNGTDARVYTANVSLKDGYVWTDSTTETKIINWEISRKKPKLILSTTNVTLDHMSTTKNISIVTYDGKADKVVATSNDESIVTTEVSSDHEIFLTASTKTGSTTVSVTVQGDANHQDVTVEVSVTNNYTN